MDNDAPFYGLGFTKENLLNQQLEQRLQIEKIELLKSNSSLVDIIYKKDQELLNIKNKLDEKNKEIEKLNKKIDDLEDHLSQVRADLRDLREKSREKSKKVKENEQI